MKLESKTIEILNKFKGINKMGVKFYLPTMMLQLTVDGKLTEYDTEEDMVVYLNKILKDK